MKPNFLLWINQLEKALGFFAFGVFLLLSGSSFLYYQIPLWLWLGFFLSLGLSFVFYIVRKSLVLYTLGRILEAAVTILIIASITFALLRLLPGGPFDMEKSLPPKIKANIEKTYHLDKSLWEQYRLYLKGLLKGRLGVSYKYTDRTVSDILKDSLPISIQLGLYSLLMAFLIGIPLGLFSAQRANSLSDRSAMILSISGISLPSFVIAPVLILFFSFYLGWFEPALWEGPMFYILPSFALGIRPAGLIARLVRSSALDISNEDYIRTARAKGLSRSIVFYKHVLKNAFLPVLALAPPLVAGILTGSFVIEKIFAVPGLGLHFVTSVTNRDYPLILGALLVYSLLLVLFNLIADLLYLRLDPRLSLP